MAKNLNENQLIACVAGATGLVGGELVKQLCNDKRYKHVIAIVRKENLELKKACGEKLSFQMIPKESDLLVGDEFYCALGTTIKKAGSQNAFKAIDYDLIMDLARRAHKGGIKRIALVSSVGSDPSSGIFYSRIKGETERDLKSIGFAQLDIYQPSFLLGARSEFRLGERIGIIFATAIAPLMIGPLAKYAPIQASELARQMIAGEKLYWGE